MDNTQNPNNTSFWNTEIIEIPKYWNNEILNTFWNTFFWNYNMDKSPKFFRLNFFLWVQLPGSQTMWSERKRSMANQLADSIASLVSHPAAYNRHWRAFQASCPVSANAWTHLLASTSLWSFESGRAAAARTRPTWPPAASSHRSPCKHVAWASCHSTCTCGSSTCAWARRQRDSDEDTKALPSPVSDDSRACTCPPVLKYRVNQIYNNIT